MAANERARPSRVVLIAFSILVLVRTSHAISCVTSVDGSNGGEAKVTCLFDRDVNATRNAFTVVQHSFNAGRDTPGTDVAVCVWVPKKEAFGCSLRDGYGLEEGRISQNVTIHVARLTDSTVGRYACHLVPPQGDSEVTLCQLNFTVKVAELSTTTTTLVTTYEVINSTAEGLNQTGSPSQVDHLPIIISSSLGGGVLVASLVVVYCICRKSRKKPVVTQERVRVEYIRPSMEPRPEEVMLLPGRRSSTSNGLVSTKPPDLEAPEKVPSAASGTNSLQRAHSSFAEVEAKPFLRNPADGPPEVQHEENSSLVRGATPAAEAAQTDVQPLLDTVDQGTSRAAVEAVQSSSVKSNSPDENVAPQLLPRRPTLKAKDGDRLDAVVPPLHRDFSIKSEHPGWRRANVDDVQHVAGAPALRREASRPTARGDVEMTRAKEKQARPTSGKQHDEYTVAIETLRSMLNKDT